MTSATKAVFFKAKSLFCIGLVLNLVTMTGCGQSALFLPESTETVELTPDHPMAVHLAGTPFEGATAIQVDKVNQRFRLVYPDNNTQVSGQFSTSADGQTFVNSFTIGQGGQVVTLSINGEQQITDIGTSQGAKWQRGPSTVAPQAPSAPRAPGAKAVATDLDSYLSANADLIAMAQQIDEQGTAEAGKDGAAAFPFAFFALSFLWFAPWGVLSTLYFVLQSVVLFNLVVG